jgi:hypothetical protein
MILFRLIQLHLNLSIRCRFARTSGIIIIIIIIVMKPLPFHEWHRPERTPFRRRDMNVSFPSSPRSFADGVHTNVYKTLCGEKYRRDESDDKCPWWKGFSVRIVCDDLVQVINEWRDPHYEVDDWKDEERAHLPFDAGATLTE